MLTVGQFAAKVGVNESSVLRWIHNGLIPGAELQKFTRGKMVYMIPDDAVRPETRYYSGENEIEKEKFKPKFNPKTEAITEEEHKKQLDFVKDHLSWSVRSIAKTLGVQTNKVRELFDELLQLHNPCNPLDCETYSTGHCEYDFATGQIMPMDEENCLLMKKEEK